MKQWILKYRSSRGGYNMTEGKEYQTLNGIEMGIFNNDPYVAVIDDCGKGAAMHLSRFSFVRTTDDGKDAYERGGQLDAKHIPKEYQDGSIA